MEMKTIVLIVVAVVVVIAVLGGIGTYNQLITKRNRIRNAWAQIDVQLQKRFDLIPNLMESVKGAANHEKETFQMVIQARNSYKSATTIDEKIKVTERAEGLFGNINALHESYPDLKANAAYMKFMDSLSNMEEQISVSRLFYNDVVNIYNDKRMTFPNNIVDGMFGFKEGTLFTINEAARENIKVSF